MSRRSNIAKHAAWAAAQRAGQLRNGRQRVGQTLGVRKSKAEVSRRACRGRVAER